MKLVYKIVLLISFLGQFVVAGNNLTSSFEFLRTDFSARSAAMSNAFTAVRGDVNGLFINPAGMAYIQERQYGCNYTDYLLDISGGSAAYAYIMEGYGVLGIGIIYMDYGNFEEKDEFANPTGSDFSANELAFTVGISNYLDDRFTYGVNLKYIFSKIHDYNASAVALDFGIIYEAPFQDDLYFAFSLMNVGSNFEYYGKTKESLPLTMRIGFTKKLAHLPLELGVALNDLNIVSDELIDRLKRFSIGGEFRLSELLRLRLGYNNDLHSSVETTTDVKFGGVSGGLGIYWRQFRFDYAYSNYGALGSTNRIGITGTIN
jgi:hypothetical protein